MLIVGERINCTRKRIASAVKKKDADYIKKVAIQQVESGADIVDVNGGIAGMEVEYLPWLVETVQEATDAQLCLDSSDADALRKALPLCKKTPMINSISDESERFEAVLPLVKEYNTTIVALCMTDTGAPNTTDDRVEIASSLVGKMTDAGVPIGNIYVDPCVFPVSTDVNNGLILLDALDQIKESLKGVNTICGLSNISFGLPNRKLINQVFMVMAMLRNNTDAVIIDPVDKQMMANIIATEALLGKDDFCMNYIMAYREGKFDF